MQINPGWGFRYVVREATEVTLENVLNQEGAKGNMLHNMTEDSRGNYTLVFQCSFIQVEAQLEEKKLEIP